MKQTQTVQIDMMFIVFCGWRMLYLYDRYNPLQFLLTMVLLIYLIMIQSHQSINQPINQPILSSNKTKQNKTKQNKTKQNKTKQNKTKHGTFGSPPMDGRESVSKPQCEAGGCETIVLGQWFSTH